MIRRPAKTAGHLPAKRPATLASHSQFGQLLELLSLHLDRPNVSQGGSPVGFWHEFPVEEAVANGLLIVILDFARKEGRTVETSDEVVAIAKRVDTLINAGLSVGYIDARAAAAAFVRTVVTAVERAVQLGFRPDDPPSVPVWKEIMAGKAVAPPPRRAAASRGTVDHAAVGEIGPFLGRPAALFFVRLINGATRHRARLEGRLAALERYNLLKRPVTWIPDSDFEFARRAIRALSIRSGGSVQGLPRRWSNWLDLGPELEACRDRIATLRRWPVRHDAFPSGLDRTSVQEGWMETVVLMALGRVRKESDFLTPQAFWKAISLYGEICRGEKGTGPLRDRLIRSLRSRKGGGGSSPPEGLVAAVDDVIRKLEGAFDDYERMMGELAPIDREMASLLSGVRKIDLRIAKAKSGRESLRESREEALDRLAQLQARHDRAKTEFRANHFPAIFMIEALPEGMHAGGEAR
ncbi:MAG TPA: hypothetical protein VGK27_06960 [Candidatus Deferrimicrobiaceae bacterium]